MTKLDCTCTCHSLPDCSKTAEHLWSDNWKWVYWLNSWAPGTCRRHLQCDIVFMTRNKYAALDFLYRKFWRKGNFDVIITLCFTLFTEKFEGCHLSFPWQQSKLSGEYGLDPDSFPPQPPQLSRDWPKGRFVWFTEDRQCRIFINFLDHLKFSINSPGSDIQKAFKKYCELLSSVEEGLKRNGKSFLGAPNMDFWRVHRTISVQDLKCRSGLDFPGWLG